MRQRLFNTWTAVDVVGSGAACLLSLGRFDFFTALFAGAWTLASPLLFLFELARPGVLDRFLFSLARR